LDRKAARKDEVEMMSQSSISHTWETKLAHLSFVERIRNDGFWIPSRVPMCVLAGVVFASDVLSMFPGRLTKG
jgi:hypothetical protein